MININMHLIKKSMLTVLILFLFFLSQKSQASVLIEPTCFITAEVINRGSEIQYPNSTDEYVKNYLNLKIINIDKNVNCPVNINQIFQATDNHPATLNNGNVIKAGIQPASSMGPNGPVSFLQWSNITYENGENVRNPNTNAIISQLQSEATPITISTFNNEQEIDNNETSNNQSITTNLFFVIILLLSSLGILIYLQLHKTFKPKT